MATLSTGASGAEVADLQRRLAALGFAVGPIDGRYGPRTAEALRMFQASAGIAPDSVAGQQTQAALAAVGAAPGQAVQGPAAASSALAPEGDTQFLAFQRALGVGENDLRAATALATGRAQRDLALRLPVLVENQRQAAQGIDDSFEARGVFASGNRVLEQARNTTEFGRQRGMAELETADRTADLQGDLARRIADGRRQTAEQGVDASQRRATSRAKLGL